MIIASRGETSIYFEADGSVSIDPPNPALARRFTRSAMGISGRDVIDESESPPIVSSERRQEKLAPGSGAHFRAVVLALGDAIIVFDDGDA